MEEVEESRAMITMAWPPTPPGDPPARGRGGARGGGCGRADAADVSSRGWNLGSGRGLVGGRARTRAVDRRHLVVVGAAVADCGVGVAGGAHACDERGLCPRGGRAEDVV